MNTIFEVLYQILLILGSLGIFIYGMKMMSDGIQKLAGSGLRNILRNMTSNKWMGILTGLITTMLIQSSSATTVMVVSFVNAGLLTLVESFGVIMGANIGTTVTSWIVNYVGLKVKITPIAIILIGLFFPFFFSKKPKVRNLSEFIIGFGILFIGLQFLKDFVPDIKENPQILEFLNHFTNRGFLSTLIFVFVGTMLTVVVQSSSASTAITLIMLSEGWIDFPMGAAMVLGENIGTTITANLAAFIANVNAKRAARFHFVFNVAGVLWMLAAMPFVLRLIESFNIEAPNDKLPIFHSAFNVINVGVMLWFLPFFERLVTWMVPSKGDEDEEPHLVYIGAGLMETPELSIVEARKETLRMGKLLQKMNGNITSLLFDKVKNPDKLAKKVGTREEITDKMEIEIANFLSMISEREVSADGSNQIQSLLSIINDMERIGDAYYEMAVILTRMRNESVDIPQSLTTKLNELDKLGNQYIKEMNENLLIPFGKLKLDKVYANETEIKEKQMAIQKSIFRAIEKNKLTAFEGITLINLSLGYTKAAGNIVNINQAIAGLK